MRRVPCWVRVAGVAVLLGGVGVWGWGDALARAWLQRRLRQQLGVETSIGDLRLRWASAGLQLRDLQLHNPPEFGGGLLLDVPALAMRLDPRDLCRGRFHFRDLRLHVTELNLVRNRNGQYNVRLPARRSSGANAPPRTARRPGGFKAAHQTSFGGIDRMELTLGRFTYKDRRHPERSTHLDFGAHREVATGLQTGEDVMAWLVALRVRVALRDYLADPAKSRSRLWDMLFRGVERLLSLP